MEEVIRPILGNGKRVMKEYNKNTTVYFFDGINTILEKYKASNWSNYSTSAAYTLAPGVVGHIISERTYSTTDLYYHYDPIGNVQFITDSYGNVVASYVQEGFGNVLASSGSLTTNNYHLTTKELEPQTGLYYFYARWYDPVVGRFITKDPWEGWLFYPETLHPYTYCDNDPINNIDSDGEMSRRPKPPKPPHPPPPNNIFPPPPPLPPLGPDWPLPKPGETMPAPRNTYTCSGAIPPGFRTEQSFD